MPVMDEFREERATIKDAPLKTKISYFWLYYKWYTIAIVAIAAFVISLIVHYATMKDNVLSVVLLNTIELSDDYGETFISDFEDYADIDTAKDEVFIDSSLYMTVDGVDDYTYVTIQKMAVYAAAQEIDLVAAEDESFEYYVYLDYFADLRDYLSEEQLEEYSPYLYYADYTLIREKNDNYDLELEEQYVYPDPTDPDSMDDPIPVGIYLEAAGEEFLNNYYYPTNEGESAIGIVINTPHPEMAVTFLDYIFELG